MKQLLKEGFGEQIVYNGSGAHMSLDNDNEKGEKKWSDRGIQR